ncbi:YqgE/AlgH family protein [Propionivibrio limicola]|uniref:YqgE/AlgH family protein n=1 Tax=Propionivibrio limicola TaxID=167645 RepID=UPI0012925AC9|nr:YqgE/AlgH family protein [Propionivibrio limicola]
MPSINLTDHFLIAMPAMSDPYFAKSLVYVAEHNEQGALGVIINRPIEMNFAALFEKIDVHLERTELASRPVFFGGPVQTDRGFVLHRPIGEWQSTLAVTDEIGLTTSRDVLQAVASHGGPNEIVLTLGYSGWGAGQLEQEISQNAWLTAPADPRIIFDLPYAERLPSAMELLGVDFANLAGMAGHA